MMKNQMTGGGNGRAFVPSTAILDEVMDTLSLDTTTAINTATATAATSIRSAATTIRPCFHGSTSNDFSDGRAYRDVIKDYLTVYKKGGAKGKFEENHMEYFEDLNFSRYVFALCTAWYLKTDQMTTMDEITMMLLLDIALKIKYLFVPANPDYAQYNRYQRAICNNDDRSVINILSRETKPYCNCMKDKKTEADNMEKVDTCFGCRHSFQREDMLKCSGCKFAMFCTTEGCYEKYWPKHKASCQGLQKVHAKITGL